ncbi:F-box only protein 15-like isoform X1 [Hippoglossus hippoglossus]|uniref:F-box only protein 15-like isoform X1 n=2 Tax=Hippoglossus hippoglossus TaxID=8267 RepID=UPI00148E615A|nr:F-box only protein 15-like isoform X1 [Hippoglossus hippoglossus]
MQPTGSPAWRVKSITSVMAAGRGEFFRSLWTGLQRQSPPEGRPPPPGRGRGRPGPERAPAGSRGRRRPPRAASSGVTWSFRREREERNCLEMKAPRSREFYLDTLPPEILLKVLSFLDASSLFCISHVCKLFHQLANDDGLWKKIYTSEFGTQTWRPKLAHDAVMEVEERPLGHWKKMYFRTLAGQEVNKWKRELRDIRPHTGLPRQTELVLRTLNVSWELTLCDCWGEEVTLRENQVRFLQSSLIVRWSEGVFPCYHHISSIQVHGVRKETQKIPRVRPSWRSLILKLDMKTEPRSFIVRDKLIKLVHLSPGVIIGSWRGKNTVAFIMVSLHFHKLVEKSLLGSPACLYSEPVENSDPALDPQGHSIHFVLHSTGAVILSEHFSQVHCRTVRLEHELLEMTVIDSTVLQQHKLLSGNIKLPWKSEELEGAVENCCIMTLTVLNRFLTPVWCVSTPIFIRMAKKPLSAVYCGEHFLMHHNGPGGKVKMKLVWVKEQKQFFLISLIIYI